MRTPNLIGRTRGFTSGSTCGTVGNSPVGIESRSISNVASNSSRRSPSVTSHYYQLRATMVRAIICPSLPVGSRPQAFVMVGVTS